MLQKLFSKQFQVFYLQLPSTRLGKLTKLTGIFFLLVSGLAWLLTFPFWQILVSSLPGLSGTVNNADPKPFFEAFFRNYPQLIWLGFVLGAALLFFPTGSTGRPPSPAQPRPQPQPTVGATGADAVTGAVALPETGASVSAATAAARQERFVASVNLAWRLWAILLLGLALAIAVYYRFGMVRAIGTTDLVAVDYDESVLFTSSVLLRHGILPYRDFISSQPPLALWLWSLPLNFGGSQWGSLQDFLNLRLFNSLFSIFTVALGYLIGRRLGGSWRGPVAGLVTAFLLALDSGIFRVDQQLMLEPPVNFFIALATLVFLYYRPASPNLSLKFWRQAGWRQELQWPLLTGLVIGAALSVKLTALPALLAFGVTLFIWKRWWAAGIYAAGAVLAFGLLNSVYLFSGGSEFIKQVVLYQFIRPTYAVTIGGQFNSSTELTTLDYLAQTPALYLTILASGLGLIAILYRWVFHNQATAYLPVVMLAVFTNLLFIAKSSFFPHYYAQIGLPFALLAGGIIAFWPDEWWKTPARLGLSLAGGLVVLFLLGTHLMLDSPDYPRPNWSWERAAVQGIKNTKLDAPGVVFTLDPRLSMLTGYPLPKDAYGKYWVENAAYAEYLTLGLNKTSLVGTFKKAFLEKKATRDEVRQLRYTDVLQNNFLETAAKADYYVWEDQAASQSTGATLASIQGQFVRTEQNGRFSLFVNQKLYVNQFPGIKFGSSIDLVGIDLPTQATATGKQGQRLTLTVLWKGEQKIAENYIIFVHLLDAKGNKVAQRDTQPQYSQLPTTKWEPGSLVLDDQSLDLPANLPPGTYTIKIGVYNAVDGKRLTIGGQATAGTIEDDNSTYNLTLTLK